MSIRVVRLGQPRAESEGIRLGTVRRPPRGVKKTDFARDDWYDVWLPDLAPSQKLVTRALKNWDEVPKLYRREMQAPAAERLLGLLAALSHQTDFSVGCYCENEERCHRSVLRELLQEHGAKLAS